MGPGAACLRVRPVAAGLWGPCRGCVGSEGAWPRRQGLLGVCSPSVRPAVRPRPLPASWVEGGRDAQGRHLAWTQQRTHCSSSPPRGGGLGRAGPEPSLARGVQLSRDPVASFCSPCVRRPAPSQGAVGAFQGAHIAEESGRPASMRRRSLPEPRPPGRVPHHRATLSSLPLQALTPPLVPDPRGPSAEGPWSPHAVCPCHLPLGRLPAQPRPQVTLVTFDPGISAYFRVLWGVAILKHPQWTCVCTHTHVHTCGSTPTPMQGSQVPILSHPWGSCSSG